MAPLSSHRPHHELVDVLQPAQTSLISVDCTDAAQPCTGRFSEFVFRGRADATVTATGIANTPPPSSISPPTRLDTATATSGVTIDLRTTTLQGTMTVNGQPPSVATTGAGATVGVRFSRPGFGEQVTHVTPCPMAASQANCPVAFTSTVYQATSLVTEASAVGLNELPSNPMARPTWPLGRVFPLDSPVTVGATPQTVSLDVKTARVRGTVTVNGVNGRLGSVNTPFPVVLQLTNRATGTVSTNGLTCAPTTPAPDCALSFDTVVARGVYEVAVLPRNLMGVPANPSARWIVGDPLELR